VGAQVIQGPARGAVAGELMEHAGEELGHAGMLVERIIQLGSTHRAPAPSNCGLPPAGPRGQC
jgi:bacterioferritin (cytochrome b1)